MGMRTFPFGQEVKSSGREHREIQASNVTGSRKLHAATKALDLVGSGLPPKFMLIVRSVYLVRRRTSPQPSSTLRRKSLRADSGLSLLRTGCFIVRSRLSRMRAPFGSGGMRHYLGHSCMIPCFWELPHLRTSMGLEVGLSHQRVI